MTNNKKIETIPDFYSKLDYIEISNKINNLTNLYADSKNITDKSLFLNASYRIIRKHVIIFSILYINMLELYTRDGNVYQNPFNWSRQEYPQYSIISRFIKRLLARDDEILEPKDFLDMNILYKHLKNGTSNVEDVDFRKFSPDFQQFYDGIKKMNSRPFVKIMSSNNLIW